MLRVAFSIFTLSYLVFAAPAAAGGGNDCQAADPDLSIRGCSAIIASKNETPGTRAVAYRNRGLAYLDKGDVDRAIADYSRTLELNPDADAYHSRGNAYQRKGEYDRAIADYGRALELNPNDAFACLGRGNAYFDIGDFAKASADFHSVLGKINSAYPILFRYLARARLGENAVSELEANASRLKSKEWAGAVIELYLGKRQPDATLAAAPKPDEECRANFFIGEWHILQGRKADAGPLLRKAVETCPKTFVEYEAAQAELKRLKP